jgi:hypothetical protein
MLEVTTSVASITFLELGDCLGGNYSRLLRMGRISSKGELACGKLADLD